MQVSTQLVVRIDPKLKRALVREIKRQGKTIQFVVGEAIEEWLKSQELQSSNPSA